MYPVKTILYWSWLPVVITALAVTGLIKQWPVWGVVPPLIIILVFGLVVGIGNVREQGLELSSQKLRQLAGYFTRRFTGKSSLSIFTIIDGLFSMENPEVWNWARACEMSQRVFNAWCDSFIDRIESDLRTKNFHLYLRTYLNELWLINNHHYEFVEQFFEVAGRFEIPREAVAQYNRFILEYNAFVQDFRGNIAEFKKITRTKIDPPTVKLAKELPLVK